MKIHTISLKGLRDSNEDALVVKQSKRDGEVIMALFDGHGGHFVSDYLSRHLVRDLTHCHRQEQITDVFTRTQRRMVANHYAETQDCGSTALVCRFRPSKRMLQTIHLGDSRAVLREQDSITVLTEDHKPESYEERMRLASEGQSVVWDREDRVYRVNGYSVSRAFGDASVPGISQQCELSNRKVSKKARYIIVACDGLWDVMTAESACNYVDEWAKKNVPEENQASQNRSNIAYLLAKKALELGSTDNVSIILTFLNN